MWLLLCLSCLVSSYFYYYVYYFYYFFIYSCHSSYAMGSNMDKILAEHKDHQERVAEEMIALAR